MIRLFVGDRTVLLDRAMLQAEADRGIAKMPKEVRFGLRALIPFVFDFLLNPALDAAAKDGSVGAGWPKFVCPKGGEYLHEVAAYALAMVEALTQAVPVRAVVVAREDGDEIVGLAATAPVDAAPDDAPADADAPAVAAPA